MERPYKIDGKDQVLRVELTLNSQKGLFTISTKFGFNKVTGDQVLDDAMLQTKMELEREAIKEGLAWRKNWLENNKGKENVNQKSLFDKEAKKEVAKKAAKERSSTKSRTKAKVPKPAKRKVSTKGKIATKKIGAK